MQASSNIKTGILGAKIHIKIHVNSLKVSSFLKNSQNSQNRQIHQIHQNRQWLFVEFITFKM